LGEPRSRDDLFVQAFGDERTGTARLVLCYRAIAALALATLSSRPGYAVERDGKLGQAR
jgi:hypothetical protein